VSNDTTQTVKPTDWEIGTVSQIRPEAPGLRTFVFTFDRPIEHEAGQHYEIRLTAADGYQAARLYSAATPADGGNALELTIALMPGGEVSPYLFNHVRAGDQLEIRGPLGRYFVWNPSINEPVLLIGGGSGVVPLRAMRLAHQQSDSKSDMKLLYSVKAYEFMAYKTELFPRLGKPSTDTLMTFTEMSPVGWGGFRGRIDQQILKEVLETYTAPPIVYACGPTLMVEAVTRELVKIGIDANNIKAERFGSTAQQASDSTN
jgi:ferredoxin-NADP reductase